MGLTCYISREILIKEAGIFKELDNILDVTGHKCPIPVLRLRRRMEALETGERVGLLATDPMTLIDIPNFCREAGHLVEDVKETDNRILYIVKKCR